MSIKRRIVSGTVVNVVSLIASAVAQIVSVPVLTSAWGVERYGAWLMLTTIPTYFVLSDLGFASAATSDMTMQVARGRRDEASATFQSVWLLVNLVSIAIIVLTVGAVVALPHISNSLVRIREQGLVLILLVLYSGLVMNARIMLAGLRATQNYALGTMSYHVMTLIEILMVLLTAWSGRGFQECAEAMLLVQSFNLFVMWALLRHRVPWLRLGFANASLPELKRLWAPALAAMAIPAALAVNLQGMVIVAGFFVSASAAATLASVRTVSRLVIQVVGTINRATIPELSAAGARDHRSALTKIVALNLASVGVILVPGAISFAIFGNHIVEIWTHGKIRPDSTLVTLIAVAMVAHGLWYYTSNLLLASNAHTLVARTLVTITICAVFVAIPCGYAYGLNGIGEILALAEIACLIGVLRVAARLQLVGMADFEYALKLRFWR